MRNLLKISSDIVLYQNYQYQKFKSNSALFFKLIKNKKYLRTTDRKRIAFFVHNRLGHSMLNDLIDDSLRMGIDSICAKNFLKWYYRKIVPNQPEPLFEMIKVIHTLQFSHSILQNVVLVFYRILSKQFNLGSTSLNVWISRFESLKTTDLLKVFMISQPKHYFEPFCSYSEKIHLCLHRAGGLPFISQWGVNMTGDRLRIYLSCPLENIIHARNMNVNPVLSKSVVGVIHFMDHKELWISLHSNNIHQHLFVTFENNRIKYYQTIRAYHLHSENLKEKSLRGIAIIRNQINRHSNISHHFTYVRPSLLTFSRTEKKFHWVLINQTNFSEIMPKSIFMGCYSFGKDFLIVVLPIVQKCSDNRDNRDNRTKFLIFALHPISLKNMRPPKLVQLSDFDRTSSTSIFDIQWDKVTDVVKISYIGYHGVYFQSTNTNFKKFFPLPCYPINYAYDSSRSIFYYPYHDQNQSGIKAIKCDNDECYHGIYATNNADTIGLSNQVLKIDFMNDTLYVVEAFNPNQNFDSSIENIYKCFRKISSRFVWTPITFHHLTSSQPSQPSQQINNKTQ